MAEFLPILIDFINAIVALLGLSALIYASSLCISHILRENYDLNKLRRERDYMKNLIKIKYGCLSSGAFQCISLNGGKNWTYYTVSFQDTQFQDEQDLEDFESTVFQSEKLLRCVSRTVASLNGGFSEGKMIGDITLTHAVPEDELNKIMNCPNAVDRSLVD